MLCVGREIEKKKKNHWTEWSGKVEIRKADSLAERKIWTAASWPAPGFNRESLRGEDFNFCVPLFPTVGLRGPYLLCPRYPTVGLLGNGRCRIKCGTQVGWCYAIIQIVNLYCGRDITPIVKKKVNSSDEWLWPANKSCLLNAINSLYWF